MTTQDIKTAIVSLIGAEIPLIPTVDAEQFSAVDLPFIGVTMTSERISHTLAKAYRGTVEIKLRAHSGDDLSVTALNEITNDLEGYLNADFVTVLNAELDGIHVDYFAPNGGIPQWESDSLECSFDCDIVFQAT